MQRDQIYNKALGLQPLDIEEGTGLYENAPLGELMFIASRLRQIHNPGRKAGWMIDRNVNISNICISRCAFCNFCRRKDSPDSYVTSMDQYRQKTDELFRIGGDQLLLQGGMNPALGLDFYCSLFRELKKLYPSLKLHALGQRHALYQRAMLSEIGNNRIPGNKHAVDMHRYLNRNAHLAFELARVLLARHGLG